MLLNRIKNKIKNNYDEDNYIINIPVVDNEEIIPKIKIYDANEKDVYWFTKIGFNRRITDAD